MHDDADLAAVVGDADLPLRIREGRGKRGERTGSLLEAFGERVGLPARTRGGDRGVTIHNIRHRLILSKRPCISARRVLTVRRGPCQSHARASDFSSRSSEIRIQLLDRPVAMPVRLVCWLI